MKFSAEFGIQLNQETRKILATAITFYRSKNQFAKACKIPPSSIFQWLREEETTTAKRDQGQWITWDVWKNIKPVLIEHELIDPNNIRWMTPSELRTMLEQIQADGSSQDMNLLASFHALSKENKKIAIELIKTLVKSQGESILTT